MSIDGIGKGPPPIPGAPGVTQPDKAQPGFRLEGAAPASASEQTTPSALELLQRGELSLDGFLDAKVDEAVAHLELPPTELEFIRGELRAQISTDPVLMELVRRTTGAVSDEG